MKTGKGKENWEKKKGDGEENKLKYNKSEI